jgi:outer membrane protein assembly factor BamD
MFDTAVNEGKPAEAANAPKPTGVNEPPRSDAPSTAPVQMSAPDAGTGVGVSIVSAPSGNGAAAADPNAVVKPVVPPNNAIPAAEAPAPAPDQVNDIKPGQAPAAPATANDGKKKKAPKPDLGDESSSRKKKKKGLGKLNPF